MATEDVDFSTFPTLDATLSPIRGRRVLAEQVCRRLFTPRGQLTFHPEVGIDVRSYLSGELTVEQLGIIREAVRAEVLEDERVQDADVEVTADAVESSITIRLLLATEEGPFDLTVAVTDLTVELLEE